MFRATIAAAAFGAMAGAAIVVGAFGTASAEEVWPAIDLPNGKAAISGLRAGDWLQTDVAAGFGFTTGQTTTGRTIEPLTFEATTKIDVLESGAGYLVVEASVRVASVRYAGVGVAFVLRGDDPTDELPHAPNSWSPEPRPAPNHVVTGDALLGEIVERQQRVAVAIASLDGARVRALITPGRDPWIGLVAPIEGGSAALIPTALTPTALTLTPTGRASSAPLPSVDAITRNVVMRALLLVTFPPVPRDLDPRKDTGFRAGGARHRVVGAKRAVFPIRGVEARVRALDPTSFARAFYAFEAINDLGFVPSAQHLTAREQANVHPALGVATWRQIDATSRFRAPGDREVVTRARWTAWLSGARVQAAEEGSR